MAISPDILERFKRILPADCWTQDPQVIAPHLREWRDKFIGSTPLMVMPRTTEHIQAIVIAANETNSPLALQGGNTGLVGGSTPGLEGRSEILLSLKKMDEINPPCLTSNSMTVGAGAILATVQEAACRADRLFPLSLASEGSCTIGGLLSTNAGGIHVIKYGTMRALVTGIEAVLPDGSLFSSLHGLAKDDTGYDLTNLLIGAEGTLGIITKARLKLFLPPKEQQSAWLSVPTVDAALSTLIKVQQFSGGNVSAFELMGRAGLELVEKHMNRPAPIMGDWSLLVDLTSTDKRPDWQSQLSDFLAGLMAEGLIDDAVIAQSKQQAMDMWAIRESLSEAQKHEGGSIKHDISLPLPAIPAFVQQAAGLCEKLVPGCRPTPFGHLGDGNLHYNVMQPAGSDTDDFLAEWPRVSTAIHDLVCEMGGSISAEHGIGTLKRDELAQRQTDKIRTMRAIKRAMDPNGILNPGRLISSS